MCRGGRGVLLVVRERLSGPVRLAARRPVVVVRVIDMFGGAPAAAHVTQRGGHGERCTQGATRRQTRVVHTGSCIGIRRRALLRSREKFHGCNSSTSQSPRGFGRWPGAPGRLSREASSGRSCSAAWRFVWRPLRAVGPDSFESGSLQRKDDGSCLRRPAPSGLTERRVSRADVAIACPC